MFVLPVLAALGASTGWATGIVLAQAPARALGAFEFTRIQLIACAALTLAICTLLGYWPTVDWDYWPAYLVSICFGIVIGNLAMIECLRRGGPRRTELLLTLKGPVVAAIAYVWLGETLSFGNMLGGLLILAGICTAILAGGDARSESDRVSGGLTVVVLLGVLTTLCQGVGFLVMKPAMLAGLEPLAASAIRLAGAAFLVSVISLWPIGSLRPGNALTPALLGRTVLPGVIGYVISSSLLLYAFANFHSGIAAVLGSLSPVIVLPILWLKEGRAPRFPAFAGALMAVAGTAVLVLA